VARLQVGVGIEKLFKDLPDALAGHTQEEFQAVVLAFQDGVETVTDAFAEVLNLFDAILSAKTALQEFGGSNLGDDFAALLRLQSESVVETLTRLTVGLSDAITNFDGSPEQLTQIASLVQGVRAQEIAALTLIDGIAKGLAANLARLKEDVTATIKGPRAAEDILFDARALITAVSQAGTPEEIAAIGQQFEALIRSLSPEDTKRFATSTLAIIDAFTAASAIALAEQKQAILDSGQAVRDMVDGFADLIDPLTIIVNSNERAAIALEAIANGEAVVVTKPLDVPNDDPTPAEVGDAIVNAIRQGFSTANVTVNVTVSDSNGGSTWLVNQ